MGNEQSKASSADNDSQSNTTASTRPTSHSSSASSGIILGAAGAQNPEPSTPLPKLNPKHPREPIKMFHSRQHQHPHPQNMSAHQQPLNAHYQGQTFVDLTDSDPEDDPEDDPKNDSEDEAMPEEHAPRDFDDGHFAAALNALEDRNRHEEQQAQVPPRMDSPHDRLEGIYDPPHPPPQQVAQANIQQDPDAFIQGEIYDLPHRAEWQDPAAGNVLWNIEDEDLDLQRYLHNEVMAAPQRRLAQRQAESAPQHEQTPRGVETQLDCINAVAQFFPGICRDYVTELYNTISQSSDTLIPHILDKHENGAPWPKAKEKQNILKRKREADEDEEAIRRYTAADRGAPHGAHVYVRACLQAEFDFTPMNFIDSVLRQNKNHLFPCYRILEEAERTWDDGRPPYNKLKKRRDNQRPHLDKSKPANLEQYLQQKPPEFIRDPVERDILTELQAARKFRQKADEKRQMKRQAELEEDLNLAKAQVEGTMSECGCCWGDFPLNRMVHCDNEEVLHWFCRGCAKQTAENEIGNSKYELHCMSMDDCEGGFSNDQRKLFLDENAIVALGRNEQEAVLRMAGIENLASCPFCPYAAEYPPVEVNRVFQCAAPDCEKASCRLCKLESHIPKSCEENAKETGLSIRRQIEEAMSAALIRTCNKCGTPFVKDEGCNKMTCTRNGCRNVQCYVCSKSCDYDHFNDTRRGGKVGNCPLFEDVSQRHDNEVQKAEKEAMERVRAEHPEYTEEDLKVKMSENVAKDDQRRKENDPILRANQHMQQMQQMYAQYPDMRPMHRPRKYMPLNVGPREAPVPLGDMFLDLVDDEDDEAEAQEIQAFLREVHQRNAAGQGLPLPVNAVDGENRARRARERLAAAQRGLGKIQNQAIENRGPRLAFIERLRNGRGNPAVAPVDGPIPAAGPPASQPVEPQHPARQHAFPEHLVLRQQLGPHQQGLFPLNEWILFGNAGEGNAQQVNVPQRPEREGGQLQAMRAQLRRLPPQPVVANQNARPEINQRIPAQLLANQAAMAQAHQMRIDAILRRQQRQQEDLEGFEEWL